MTFGTITIGLVFGVASIALMFIIAARILAWGGDQTCQDHWRSMELYDRTFVLFAIWAAAGTWIFGQ